MTCRIWSAAVALSSRMVVPVSARKAASSESLPVCALSSADDPVAPRLPWHVVQHAVDVHVLPRREVAVETGILEHHAESLADLGWMCGRVESVELERAARRPQQGGEHLDGGGLAGPVRPEEREDLAGPHVERDVVDRLDVAARHDDVLDADDGTIAHDARTPRSEWSAAA